MGGDVASIHSEFENEFITGLPGIRSSSLWIGIHFLQNKNNATQLNCINSDKSKCDYGLYTELEDPNRQNYPWLVLPPLLNDTIGNYTCKKYIFK
jgi:hypothetical protein